MTRTLRFAAYAAVLGAVLGAVLAPLSARGQLPGGSLIVTVTSPAAGSTVSGTIPVSASVSIVGSLTVSRVDFFVDGNFIGSDTGAPYSVSWDTRNVGNGSHSLTAVAQDILGVRWTSSGVSVTVSNDTTRPTVTINKASTQADPTSSSPINFTAVFSEAVSGFTNADVAIGGTALGTKTVSVSGSGSTYNVAVSGMTSSGTVSATIAAGVAQDAAGNTNTASTSTDNTVQFNLPDTTRPTVSITSPRNGDTISGVITVTADASDAGGVTLVQFLVDGVELSRDTTAPYEAVLDTRQGADGAHTLQARAQDTAGNIGESAVVTVTVSNAPPPDTTPPTVTINQAATQADPTSSSPINFTVVFSEPVSGFTGTDVTITGTALGTKTVTVSEGPSTYTAAVSGMTSSGTVIATLGAGLAQDAAGNTNTASTSTDNTVTFNLPDTTPPTVSLTSPADGATVSGTTSVTASASDNIGVVGVEFLLDGVVRADDTSAPYSVPWDTTTVGDGSHTLTAIARDAAGNRTTSAPVTVSVSSAPPPDTTPPTVSLTSPADGATVSGTTSVTASASDEVGVAGVRFFVGSVEIGIEDTTAPYEVSWNTATLANGTHTLKAIARDAAGNSASSAGVTVSVSNEGGTTVTRSEERAATFASTGWVLRGPEIAAFSGGTAASSNVAGDTASFTFTGTAVSWIGLKCSVCGIATVSIDGGAPISVDTAGAAAVGSFGLASEVVFTSPTLEVGAHTLVITVTGDTTSGGAHIVVDAFDVVGGSGSAATRIEETGPGVSVTGAWTLRGAEIAIFSGGSAGSSNATGATLTLDFTGTAVSWIGLRCSVCGIATVSIDGGPANAVDTAGTAVPGSSGLASEAVFSALDLAAGSHRLVITVTGITNTGAAHIVVDAFDVTP